MAIRRYRNKTFVSFDATNDIRYYRLMQAWKTSDSVAFNFHDAHDLNNLREDSNETTIKRKLRQRLANTKLFISLIGDRTKFHYTFVRWEAQVALELDLPVIVVNINRMRQMDPELCLPLLREELAIHVSYQARIIQYAIDSWPQRHRELRGQGVVGPRYYTADVYRGIGL